MVLAHAHILAGMELGAALADQDVAGAGLLAAEKLHTQAPARRIAAVARAAACFFMGHGALLLLLRLVGVGLLGRGFLGGRLFRRRLLFGGALGWGLGRSLGGGLLRHG